MPTTTANCRALKGGRDVATEGGGMMLHKSLKILKMFKIDFKHFTTFPTIYVRGK